MELRPLNIALIDDEPGVLLALKLTIQTLGHEVRDFASAQTALAYLGSAAACDLVICDLRMPVMNGFDALQEVRKLRPDVAFVMISGHAETDDIEKAMELGADSFLCKPFTPEELHQAIRENTRELL